MNEGTIRLTVVCVALSVIATLGSMSGCVYGQYKVCLDARVEAIKAKNDVLAASMHCSPVGNDR